MKRRMITGMMLLVLTVSGCSAVSTAPTTINELVEETRAEAETESTDSILPSESEKADAPVESKSPEETESPESAAAPETAASQPIAEEAPKSPEPAASVSSESKQPAAETTPAPEETKPKTAYDYEFDIAAIKADCIGIGQSMGLSLDSSLTPDNAAWWNPVTASQSNQGEALKQSLESYITFHTAANLGSYGMDEITDFNIYCEARGNGEYLIYFLFA
jgi:type IV secretory pathway VirB10-like protein